MAIDPGAARDRLLKDVTDALLITDISYEESQRQYTEWALSEERNYDKLVENGFRNLHALEPCKEFIPQMEEKKVYQKIFETCVGRGSIVDVPDGTYDAIVASGSFGPGCIPCDAIYEVVRLLKPGGYFANFMRKEYLWTVPEYRDRLKPLMKLLERDGRWKQVKWETYPGHFFSKDGIMMLFQRC